MVLSPSRLKYESGIGMRGYHPLLEKAEDVPGTKACIRDKCRLWRGFSLRSAATCLLCGSTGEFQNRRDAALLQNASVAMDGAGIPGQYAGLIAGAFFEVVISVQKGAGGGTAGQPAHRGPFTLFPATTASVSARILPQLHPYDRPHGIRACPRAPLGRVRASRACHDDVGRSARIE